MPASRNHIQKALQKPYDRMLFSKEVLSTAFGSSFSLRSSLVPAAVQPNKSEQEVIDRASVYGKIELEDNTEITCYEIVLQSKVRIEQSKVAIQRYLKKLLSAGQVALVNFISPGDKNTWRLTLIVDDSKLAASSTREKSRQAKRYTYLLGPAEICNTAAERFEALGAEKKITVQALINAFSVERLSKAFFDEYALHYAKFIGYIGKASYKKRVFRNDDKAIRDFVKKLMGRIVFLYFVQKKRWLGASDTQYKDGVVDFVKQFFQSSGGRKTFYNDWLTVLFFDTLNKKRTSDDFRMPDGKKVKVPFLNGGLFDQEEYDEHIIGFDPNLFHNVGLEDIPLLEKNKSSSRGFLDFLNAFNFTVHEDSPDNQTVAVDPEMLGHIFENLLEDNKDKGAFYTPKEIVQYMSQQSLLEYLSTHLGKDKSVKRDDLDYLVKHKAINGINTAQLKRIDQLLGAVKICDPAIGSGAFPMGLLQDIIGIKEVIAFELKIKWNPAGVKKHIIQNSIYGVDIEKGAVDIARLRFWLSLVVDEDKPQTLPNLDYKIMVGDSLVNGFENKMFKTGEKQRGFDIVIGNPPYLNFKMYSSEDKLVYKKLYPDVFDGKADVYYYFFRKSFNLCKPGGITSLITSRYWIEAEFAKKLRKFFTTQTSLKEIIDFKNVTVFDGIGIKTCITSFIKASKEHHAFNYLYHPGKKIDYIDLSEYTVIPIPATSVQKDSWNLTNEESTEIISEIEKDAVMLDEIAHCKQGIVTGLDKAFITTDSKFKSLPRHLVKPWLKVGDIHKYAIRLVEKRELVYTKLIKDVDDYPAFKKRLLPFKEKLLNRREAKSGKIRWFDLQWPREQEMFDSEKLICRFKAQENTFCYDDSGFYSSADTTVVALNEKGKKHFSTKYLLALLNSKVLSFYFRSYGKLMDYRYEYYPGPVGRLRIKHSDDQVVFETMVDYVLFLHDQSFTRTEDQEMAPFFEQVIDGLVYELYFPGLLKKNGCGIMEHLGELPGFTGKMNEDKKMGIVKAVYGRLNEKKHAVRSSLSKLHSISEIVRMAGS
jgi:type I restriction-modification system DNA methylase subunit